MEREGVREGVRKGEVNSPGPGRQLGDVVRENNRQTDGRIERSSALNIARFLPSFLYRHCPWSDSDRWKMKDGTTLPCANE